MTKRESSIRIREKVKLAPYTTLRVGGAARFFAQAEQESEVIEACEYASSRRLPLLVLGGGSNILVSDSGFPGLVLQMAVRGIDGRDAAATGNVSVAAGEDWDVFVRWCIRRNLAGVECLSGIPGTVGAAPIQNIGAYGQEVAEVIQAVQALDRRTGQVTRLNVRQCRFDYRTSVFNTTDKDRFIILSVDFHLHIGGAPRLKHADLESRFAAGAEAPTLASVRAAVLEVRKRKGMIREPGDPGARSAGSFFKNPQVSSDTLLRMEQEARRQGVLAADENIPRFEGSGGRLKLPAAWLVERAGFPKGHVAGRVGISDKHALALINRGGATAMEIQGLACSIQASVRRVFGIELMPEAVYVGFES